MQNYKAIDCFESEKNILETVQKSVLRFRKRPFKHKVYICSTENEVICRVEKSQYLSTMNRNTEQTILYYRHNESTDSS